MLEAQDLNNVNVITVPIKERLNLFTTVAGLRGRQLDESATVQVSALMS